MLGTLEMSITTRFHDGQISKYAHGDRDSDL